MLGTTLLGFVVITQTVESAFISACCKLSLFSIGLPLTPSLVLYAVLKSSRADGQGRMSIQISVKDYKDAKFYGMEQAPASDLDHIPRGWWDYVPEPSNSEFHAHQTEIALQKSLSDHPGPLHAVGNILQLSSYPSSDVHGTISHRKVPPAAEQYMQQPLRAPSIAFSTQHTDNTHDRLHPRQLSPAPGSVMSRLSKFMPRMQLFREVLKNEVVPTNVGRVTMTKPHYLFLARLYCARYSSLSHHWSYHGPWC